MAAILYDVMSRCVLIRIKLKIWKHLYLMLIPYMRAVPKIMSLSLFLLYCKCTGAVRGSDYSSAAALSEEKYI